MGSVSLNKPPPDPSKKPLLNPPLKGRTLLPNVLAYPHPLPKGKGDYPLCYALFSRTEPREHNRLISPKCFISTIDSTKKRLFASGIIFLQLSLRCGDNSHSQIVYACVDNLLFQIVYARVHNLDYSLYGISIFKRSLLLARRAGVRCRV